MKTTLESLALAAAALVLPVREAGATTVLWTNTAGGNWSVGANWSSGALPTAADDVLITAAGTYSVTQDVHTTVASLTLGGASGMQTLINNAFSLTLSKASAVDAVGVFRFGAGTVLGPGLLTVNGRFNWTGGNLRAPTVIAAGGVLELSGATDKGLTGGLTNHGTLSWSGAGNLLFDPTWIDNRPGALFDIRTDASLVLYSGAPYVTNAGTIRKSAGTGATVFHGVPLRNTGTIEAQTGSIVHNTTGTIFDPGSRFLGAGTNRLVGGLITLNGPLFSENLEMAGAAIAGTNTLSGTVLWTSGYIANQGVVTIASDGTLELIGPVEKAIVGVLLNRGHVRLSDAGRLGMGSQTVTALIDNQPGGLFEVTSDAPIVWTAFSQPAITNAGTFRKTGGAGTTLIDGIPFGNTGVVEAQTGAFAFNTTGTLFGPGTRFLGAGTNRLVAGLITLNGPLFSENLEMAGAAIAGTSTLNGVVNWTSGYIANQGVVTIATNTTLNLSGPVEKAIVGVLRNQGHVRLSDAGRLGMGSQTVTALIDNQPGGWFEVTSDAPIVWTAFSQPAITNAGTFRKSGGTGTTAIDGIPFGNSGIVEAQTGAFAFNTTGTLFDQGSRFVGAGTNRLAAGWITLNGDIFSENLEIGAVALLGTSRWSGAVRWTAGYIAAQGVVTIAPDGVLDIAGPADKGIVGVLANQGRARLSGTGTLGLGSQTVTATLHNQPGGLFEMMSDAAIVWTAFSQPAITNAGLFRKSAGTGTTVSGVPFANTGTVDAQTGTILFTAAAYSQTSGTMRFGLNSLTNHGRIQINGPAPLAGVTLAVNLNGGYVPVTGDAFTLLLHGGRTGAFAGFDLPSQAAWQTDDSIYRLNDVTLTVLNVRPTMRMIADQAVDEETALNFSIVGVEPDTGQTLSYALLAPPAGATLNAGSGLFSWTPSEVQGPSTNLIAVRVTDSGTPSLSATSAFTVVVREVNRAPTLAAIEDRVVVPGHTLAIANAASDPDVPLNTLRFTLSEHPPNAAINAETGLLTWTTRSGDAGATNRFTVVVRDNGVPSLSATQSFRARALPLPRLAISRTGEAVQLAWPALYTGYTLEATTNLKFPEGWGAITNAASLVGTNRAVLDPVTADPTKLYRLIHP